jgi:transposase
MRCSRTTYLGARCPLVPPVNRQRGPLRAGPTPRHSSGRPRRFDRPEKLAALRAQLRADPDLSLVERCERLRQGRGIQVSEATLSRVLRRVLGWSHKKNQPERQRTRRSRAGRLARPYASGVQT